MAKTLKFLQVSDVHLDSSFSSGLNMPADKIDIRKREQKVIITKVCQIVKDEKIDMVLIPGDLIDYESSTTDTTNFLIDSFCDISPIPVIITPGNHDFYSPSSAYNPEFLFTKERKVWSDNVIIFRDYKFESICLPQFDDIYITGMSYFTNVSINERLLKSKLPMNSGGRNILIFHGSLDGYCPSDKKVTLPFSKDELLTLEFSYAAIGHYHSYSEILDEAGNVKGAYSGCPLGRNLRECGEKFIIIGHLDNDGKVEIEKRKIDDRTLYEVQVDCTGLEHNERVLNTIEKKVREKTNNKRDIIFVRLSGRFPPGNEVNIPEDFLRDDYFHVAFDESNIQPDYDIQKYLSETTGTIESIFVKELSAMIENISDKEEKREIEDAIYYGLDALTLKSVKPRFR